MTEAPHPFAYPPEPTLRRHGPNGYSDYIQYKPWLRDEFAFRCVYCLEREAWYPSRADAFGVDHFVSTTSKPDRNLDYANLVYACNRCNSYKGLHALDPNPMVEASSTDLFVSDDGELHGITRRGRDLIRLLHLNENPAIAVRRESLCIRQAMHQHPDDPVIRRIFLARYGYPEDMPDLRRLRPPGGNRMTGSEQSCHFAQRERGMLADAY